MKMNTMINRIKRRLLQNPETGWLMFLAVICIIVILPDLGEGFWDAWESHYGQVAKEMHQAGDWLYPTYKGKSEFSKPILLYWLELIGFSIFGVSEWAARLPVALSGCASVLFTFWCVRILFGRRTGIASALILLATPMFVPVFRQIMFDGPFVAAVWCGLLSLTTGLFARRRFIYFALFYILCAFAVLSKGLLGLAIPIGAVGLYIIITFDFRILGRIYLGRGLGLFALVALPWYIYMYHRFGQYFIDVFIVENHIRRLVGETKLLRNTLGTFEYYVNNLGYALFPLSAAVPVAVGKFMPLKGLVTRRSRARLMIFLAALVPMVIITAAETKFNHYVFPAVPPLAVMLAWYADRILTASSNSKHTASFRIEIIIALVLLGLMTLDLFRNFKAIIEIWNYYVDRPLPESINPVLPIVLAAAATAVGLVMAGIRPMKTRIVKAGLILVLAAGFCLNWYISHPLFVELTPHYTMKQILEKYEELRQPGDRIGEFSKWYRGTIYYSPGNTAGIQRGQSPMRHFLQGSGRRFIIVGREDYDLLKNTLRSVTDRNYRLVDDSSERFYMVLVDAPQGTGQTVLMPSARINSTAPSGLVQADAVFGEFIKLVGYRLPLKLSGDESSKLVMHFEMLAEAPEEYRIFVHLESAQNRIPVDIDFPRPAFPLKARKPGESFTVDIPLAVNPQKKQPASTMNLLAGLYRQGYRLPVTSPGNMQVHENRLFMGSVPVR